MDNIVGEVGIVVSICTTNVVALTATALNQLLEVRHDGVVATLTGIVYTEVVVNILSTVERENHVVALLVKELHHLVGEDHAIGGVGEAEVLASLALNLSCILNEALYHVEVKRGLTAEEVNLKVTAAAGVLHKEIKSTLTNLKGHKGSVALILTLTCEAVGAVKVAGMSNVKAERLNHLAVILKVGRKALVGVNRIELACRLKRCDIVKTLENLLLVYVIKVAVLLHDLADDLLSRVSLVHCDDVVGNLVDGVNRAGRGVKDNIISI